MGRIRLVGSALVIGLAGCGGPTRPSGDDDADAGGLPTRCDPSAEFGAPVPVAAVNTIWNDTHPFLSADELTLYFAEDQFPTGDITDLFMSVRPSLDAAWSEPVRLDALVPDNSYIFGSSITADGLELYLGSSVSANGDILVSRRESVFAEFSAATPVSGLFGNYESERDPYVLPDGSAMYFVDWGFAHEDGEELFRAERSGNGFGPPVLVPGPIQGPAVHVSKPVVTADERTMYFGSISALGEPNARFEIMVTNRASVDDAWGTPVRVPALASDRGREPGWLSADGCVLYLHGWVEDGHVHEELFVATKPPSG